jgi:hypothetical protein
MSLTIKGLLDLERSYRSVANAMSKGEARAIKRVGVTIGARQSRAITETVNLKSRDVKDAIVTKRQPTADALQVVFEVREKPISLIDYGGTGSWKRASVKVLKASGRKRVQGGFLTNTPQGAPQIWKRTGESKRLMTKGRYAGQVREPIKKLFGPSILSQYIKAAVQQLGADTWAERLPIELERETDFALKQAGLI